MKTTRRHALLIGAAAPCLASEEAQSQTAPKTPQDELESAREANQRRREDLAKVALKNDVEPAFIFRAG